MDIHSTFKVSDSGPTILVLQAWHTQDRPIVTCAIPVSSIADLSAQEVASGIGFLLMAALSQAGSGDEAQSPIDQYPSLLVLHAKHQMKGGSTVCPATRSAHLRMFAAKDPNRLLIQQCEHGIIGRTVDVLSLPRLAMAGNTVAGEALLRAMAGLHPDTFATMPWLLSD